MGYMKHNAILVTVSHPNHLDGLLKIIGTRGSVTIHEPVMNGYVTLCLAPDGSKEGWGDSERGDRLREDIVAWLENPPDRVWPSWVEIQYGSEEPSRHPACVLRNSDDKHEED